jgi:DNA-binding beta-propeller fold protein YncE
MKSWFSDSSTGLRLVAVAIMSLILAACAEIQSPSDGRGNTQLVFPPPPDQPRFTYERTIYSAADVVPDAGDSALRRLVTGESRSGEGLAKPYAIAVHQGRIFVSDSAERFVKVFDWQQGRFFRIGEDDPGRLMKPLGVDVDQSGTLYVADATLRAVLVYDRDGKYLRKIGGEKMFDRLSSVTVDQKATRLYVVDIGGVQSENHRVRVFDPVSGKHLFDFGHRGKEPGEFNLPRDVAIGKEGQLYVVDGGNFRVQVFDGDGKYRNGFGTVGRQTGNFARPKEIATDREGNVYVADAAFGNFQIFNSDGDMLMFVGNRSEIDGPAKYMLPSGIFVDEDGRIYFVDQWYRKIDIYRPVSLKPEDGYLGKRQTNTTAH